MVLCEAHILPAGTVLRDTVEKKYDTANVRVLQRDHMITFGPKWVRVRVVQNSPLLSTLPMNDTFVNRLNLNMQRHWATESHAGKKY